MTDFKDLENLCEHEWVDSDDFEIHCCVNLSVGGVRVNGYIERRCGEHMNPLWG